MKIAIQGEPGSFSHEAALKLVPDAEIVPCALSAEVFAALDRGAADAAAIPIENSLAGSVLEHFDLLLHHDVRVVRETLLRIRHNLIAIAGAEIDEIDRVFSHPVALGAVPALSGRASRDEGRCLLRHRRQREATGEHARPAGRGHRQRAGGALLRRGDSCSAASRTIAENYTRFFLVRRSAEAETDPAVEQDERGLFARAPAGLAGGGAQRAGALGTNLTKIESRPVQGKPWEYIFYVDCQIGSSRRRHARP